MATKTVMMAMIGLIPIALIQPLVLKIAPLMVWILPLGVEIMAFPLVETKSLSLLSLITPMVSTLELGLTFWTHQDQSISHYDFSNT